VFAVASAVASFAASFAAASSAVALVFVAASESINKRCHINHKIQRKGYCQIQFLEIQSSELGSTRNSTSIPSNHSNCCLWSSADPRSHPHHPEHQWF
jgi:hypothetical protein